MKNTKFDKLIMLFLILQPFLDVITAWQTRVNSNILSVGTILRGLFLIVMVVYLIINKKERKIILMFAIYVLLAIGYQFFYSDNNIVSEITNFMKMFYLPFLIYTFNNYENSKIDDKFLTIIYMIYLNLLIIPYIFSFGYNTYDAIYEKRGYIGLFYAGNELSGIIIGLLPLVLNYVTGIKNIFLKILIIIETITSIILVGTKTLLLGFVIVIAYFYIKYMIKCFKENKNRFRLLLIVPFICLFVGILVLPKLPVYTNLKITLKFYEINSPSDLIKIDNIDNVVFSGRISYLKNVNKHYIKQDILTKLFGLGNDKVMSIKDVEIDIFDIFYNIGIIGIIIWLLLMINAYRKQKLKGIYKFSFILFIIMSLFSGHVLIQPMVNTYIALLFMLNKNKKLS